MNNKYNGWDNWETWNFKLWLDNEEIHYRVLMEYISSCAEKGLLPKSKLVGFLEGMAETMVNIQLKNPEGASFIHDAVNMSIKQVNFQEIADAYLQDYALANLEIESD